MTTVKIKVKKRRRVRGEKRRARFWTYLLLFGGCVAAAAVINAYVNETGAVWKWLAIAERAQKVGLSPGDDVSSQLEKLRKELGK